MSSDITILADAKAKYPLKCSITQFLFIAYDENLSEILRTKFIPRNLEVDMIH